MPDPATAFSPAPWALAVAVLCFLLGFLGLFLPLLPGPVLIWAGVVLHKLWVPAQSVPWWVVGLATALMVASLLLDYLATLWGARRFGASAWGAAGALLGGLVGLFLPPPLLWIFLGPFCGAILAEMIRGRSAPHAFRAGLGTLVGGLAALALKLALGLATIALFFLHLPPSSP